MWLGTCTKGASAEASTPRASPVDRRWRATIWKYRSVVRGWSRSRIASVSPSKNASWRICSRVISMASLLPAGMLGGPSPTCQGAAMGQFASPGFVASGPAALNVHARTPRAAGPLAPRLARNLPHCRGPYLPTRGAPGEDDEAVGEARRRPSAGEGAVDAAQGPIERGHTPAEARPVQHRRGHEVGDRVDPPRAHRLEPCRAQEPRELRRAEEPERAIARIPEAARAAARRRRDAPDLQGSELVAEGIADHAAEPCPREVR